MLSHYLNNLMFESAPQLIANYHYYPQQHHLHQRSYSKKLPPARALKPPKPRRINKTLYPN